jgi:PhnB protein
MTKAKSPIPAGLHSVTPQLTMDNAAAAIDWYKEAFGANEVARAVSPDGKIMHAEVRVGDCIIMLNDDMMGGNTVKALGGSPVSMWVYVEDCDALFNRALQAGGRVADGPMGQMQDQFWGDRSGTVIDPEGYRWNIATHKEDLSPDEMKTRSDEFFRQFEAAHS